MRPPEIGPVTEYVLNKAPCRVLVTAPVGAVDLPEHVEGALEALGERGGVVHAVADHGDHPPPGLQATHDLDLVLRQDLGDDGVDADALRRDLDKVRARGYATSHGETVEAAAALLALAVSYRHSVARHSDEEDPIDRELRFVASALQARPAR